MTSGIAGGAPEGNQLTGLQSSVELTAGSIRYINYRHICPAWRLKNNYRTVNDKSRIYGLGKAQIYMILTSDKKQKGKIL